MPREWNDIVGQDLAADAQDLGKVGGIRTNRYTLTGHAIRGEGTVETVQRVTKVHELDDKLAKEGAADDIPEYYAAIVARGHHDPWIRGVRHDQDHKHLVPLQHMNKAPGRCLPDVDVGMAAVWIVRPRRRILSRASNVCIVFGPGTERVPQRFAAADRGDGQWLQLGR